MLKRNHFHPACDMTGVSLYLALFSIELNLFASRRRVTTHYHQNWCHDDTGKVLAFAIVCCLCVQASQWQQREQISGKLDDRPGEARGGGGTKVLTPNRLFYGQRSVVGVAVPTRS